MLHMWKMEPYGQKLLAKKRKREEGSRNAARVSKRK